MPTLLTLTCLLSAAPSITAQGQSDGAVPVSLSLGAIRTESDRPAIRIAVHADKPISANDLQGNFRNGLIYLAPEIRIETGEADAFNAIITKVTGSVLFFTTTEVGGVETRIRASSMPFPSRSAQKPSAGSRISTCLPKPGTSRGSRGAFPAS